jgi:signal transduction histidine kinase
MIDGRPSVSPRRSLAAKARARTKLGLVRRTLARSKRSQGAERSGGLVRQSGVVHAQLRGLAHQILGAQEEERKKISLQLHDEIAQTLAGINVQLAILHEVAAINTRGLNRKIAAAQRLVEQSVTAVHRFAKALRPALLDDLGLIPALRSYMKALPGRRGRRIHFTAFPGVEAMESAQRTVLYRVSQEALTNIVRHAQAKVVTVHIKKIASGVQLEIADDGKSFRPEKILASKTNRRMGLIGMRERVEMVGGTFAIQSAPGQGTTVRAKIPFNRKIAA